MAKKETVVWSIPVPKPLDDAVEKAVKLDMHASKSDLVRDAVRRLLAEISAKAAPE